MIYTVDVAGLITGTAQEGDTPAQGITFITVEQALSSPDLYRYDFERGVFHPDQGLVAAKVTAIKAAKLEQLVANFNVLREGPVIMDNLSFQTTAAFVDQLTAVISDIESHGTLPAGWIGIQDFHGVYQFEQEGLTTAVVLSELKAVKRTILNSNAFWLASFTRLRDSLQSLDVLEALENFDTTIR
jgi:hypothetical protein